MHSSSNIISCFNKPIDNSLKTSADTEYSWDKDDEVMKKWGKPILIGPISILAAFVPFVLYSYNTNSGSCWIRY